MLKVTHNTLEIFREGEIVRVEAYGPDVVRVRAAAARMKSQDWTLLKPADAEVQIRKEENGYTLQNGTISAKVTKDGQISFWNQKGELLLKELWQSERDLDARKLKGRTGDLFYIEQCFHAVEGEHFYGLGQEAHDLFDLKGAVLDLCQQNTKSTIPFVISSKGYGFLWNNPAIGRVEFGTSRTRWVAEAASQLDYLVIGGDLPSEIEKNYCKITGYAPELPMWATGLWQSKLRYESQ